MVDKKSEKKTLYIVTEFFFYLICRKMGGAIKGSIWERIRKESSLPQLNPFFMTLTGEIPHL